MQEYQRKQDSLVCLGTVLCWGPSECSSIWAARCRGLRRGRHGIDSLALLPVGMMTKREWSLDQAWSQNIFSFSFSFCHLNTWAMKNTNNPHRTRSLAACVDRTKRESKLKREGNGRSRGILKKNKIRTSSTR